MREKHLEVIRAACIKANPEIEKRERVLAEFGAGYFHPIRLADVLLAIGGEKGQTKGLVVNTLGQMTVMELIEGGLAVRSLPDIIVEWNLRRDDLTQQSDECVAFVASLFPTV